MNFISLLFTFAASVGAFMLSTLTGGGAGLLLLPVLGASLPGAAVPAALTVGTTTSTVSKLALFRRHVRWSITRVFVPAAVPGVLLGAALLKYLNPLYLELVMGAFLVSNLALLFRRTVPVAATAPPGWARLAATGFAAGFLSGLTGAVGLLFNTFYFRHGLSRDEVIGTRAANELLLHVLKLVLYGTLGLLTPAVWQAGAAVAVGAVLATSFAKRVVQHLPEQQFRRIGYGAMVVSGMYMLSSAGQQLATTENLRATAALYGSDVEVTGWWRSSSVTLEVELDEGLSVEHPVRWRDVPPPVQQAMLADLRGRRVLKIEEVWQFGGRSYELYLRQNQQVVKLEFAAPQATQA